MRLTDFNEENPPTKTRDDEIERLLGKGIIRVVEMYILLYIAGVDLFVTPLIEIDPWWLMAAGVLLGLRAAWPLLCGLEHLSIQARRKLKQIRGSRL